LWRYSAGDIPLDSEEDFREWLYQRWFELDDWLDGMQQVPETSTQTDAR
jgi:hypothetical protein